MRTVTAPTDHVVVVGAGLAGLAAALYLRGSGRRVTVLERDIDPGGRVGVFRGPDYEADSGATVLTMPALITDALAAVGAAGAAFSTSLRFVRVEPGYHARFADGRHLDVYADRDAMIAEVQRVCGAEQARRYVDLRRWLGDVFDAEYERFMASNVDSPLDLVATAPARRDLARLVRLGGFGRLGRRVAHFVTDPDLARVFTFQALYAGMAPAQALGVYAAIPHMDTSLGVYFPVGGMRAIARSMADALRAAGGVVETNTDVDRIEYAGRRATRVCARDGRRFDCDALVLTVDLGQWCDFDVPAPKVRASPSAVVALGTIPTRVSAAWPDAHHTIDFGAAWTATFADILGGRLMRDPSLLITRPARTDPGLLIERADGGSGACAATRKQSHEPLSVLAPCPNLDTAALTWPTLGPAYLREVLGVLEHRGYVGIREHFTVDRLDTPQTWRDRGMLAGSPFSAAHLFRQTGPFRAPNLVRTRDNVVLAGCGTVPGVGVPTVLLSGRLAAARITGEAGRAHTR
ncbi:MAG TPA: phytoene desaturase family protein [Aldersonia sp.]